MLFLKEDTAATIKLGPFVDKSTGVDYEIGIAAAMNHANTGVRISKNGGAFAARTTLTIPVYDAFGYYLVNLDVTDTGTPGTLQVIYGDAATCLPCEANFMVVSANIYDSLFGAGTVFIKTDMTQILAHTLTNTGTQIADAFQTFFDIAAPTGTVNLIPAVTTVGTVTGTISDKSGYALSATGADLILKSSTFVQAIVAAINEFATYGLTALNTLLVTTGIKAASVPAVTVTTNNDKTGYSLSATGLDAVAYDATGSKALAKGVWADTTAGDFTVAGSVGKSVMNGVALGTGLTVNDITTKTGYALSATGADLILKTATFALAVADAVWDEDITGHMTANSAGQYLNALIARVAQCGDAGSPTTIDLDGAASAVNDYYKGQLIAIVYGTGVGQARACIGYDGATKIATIGPAWATPPDGDSWFVILNMGSSVVSAIDNIDFSALMKTSLNAATPSVPSADSISDSVWNEAIGDHLGAGSTGLKLNVAGDPWTTELPGTYTGIQAGHLLSHIKEKTDTLGGAGAVTWTYTLTDSITGLPIDGAEVWVTTDSAGLNIIASGTTNAYGIVTFSLDAGVVYIWRKRSGYNFVNPDQETVA